MGLHRGDRHGPRRPRTGLRPGHPQHADPGRTAGLATAAGIATGLAGYTALAALGVAVLVSASTTALVVLRFAGAGYLVLLGLQSLAALRRGAGGRAAAPSPSRSGRGAPFLQGLLNNSLNPKALVFFFTFMPQFVVPDAPVWPQTLFLGGTVVVLAAVWWLLYVLAIARLSALLRRPRSARGSNSPAASP